MRAGVCEFEVFVAVSNRLHMRGSYTHTHTRAHTHTHTPVWPSVRTSLHSRFTSTRDLIEAVMASCHLPAISDGSLTVNFGGRPHIDGGLLSVLTPPPGAEHVVNICSLPSKYIARLPGYITRPKPHEVSISPDSYQPWPHSRSHTHALATLMPQDDFLRDM